MSVGLLYCVQKANIVIFLFFITTFVIVTITGCRKDSPQSKYSDPVIYNLRAVIDNNELPLDAKNRAESALLHWKNKNVDSKPILICTGLARPHGVDDILLSLIFFDEDKDISGFVITEEYLDSNDIKTTLLEDYPTYVHNNPLGVVDAHWFEVNIRDNNQRKDEILWQDYTSKNLEELTKSHNQSETSSVNNLETKDLKKETLPPIFVAIPEPNKIDVWIYIYDKAGNKSDPIKLLNWLDNQ